MMPQELELAAISSLRTAAEVRQAAEMGIAEDSFQIPELAVTWLYLKARADRDEAATPADVKAATGVELVDATDFATFAGELAKKTTARRALAVLQAHIREVDEDPGVAVRAMVSDLNDIIRVAGQSHTRSFDSDADYWIAKAEEKARAKAEGRIIGIPTGLPIFDNNGDTWKAGDLIAIIGATNAGKSTLLLHFGVTAWMAGKKVLYLSPESTVDDVKNRWDPMVSRRKYGMTLSNLALRNGMTQQQLEVYRQYATMLALDETEGWDTRDSGEKGIFSIEDIIAHTRQNRPDLVCLDGFHLIRGTGGAKGWETIKLAAETIKGLAQDMGITVIAGSQARRDAVIAVGDVPELGDTAYGMALIEAANRVISLATAKRKNDQMRVFKVPKNRDGPVIDKAQYLMFDVDAGNIAQYDPDVDRDTGEVAFNV